MSARKRLEMVGISKTFETREQSVLALDDVSISLAENEFVT